MIVEMKKVAIAMLNGTINRDLEAIRDLGVIHIEHAGSPESEATVETSEKIGHLNQALESLPKKGAKDIKTELAVHPEEEADRILALAERKTAYREQLKAVVEKIEGLKTLGHFSPSDFQWLSQQGFTAKIYCCSKGELRRRAIPVPHAVVGRAGSARYVLAVAEHDFDLPLEALPVPERSLEDIKKQAEAIEQGVAQVEDELKRKIPLRPYLEKRRTELMGRLEFLEAAAGMGQEGDVSYLKGYCPACDIQRLKDLGKEMGWAVMAEEPQEKDGVPTFIKNPRWLRIVEPVFNFMGTVPGYDEFDVSFWFLVSLCVFSAMLVGDGGYGLLFFIGTAFGRWRLKSAPKQPFVLLYVFSAVTILWGLITGTWFGVTRLSEFPFLNRFVMPVLNSSSRNQDFMIQLCFTLGAVHLSIAHMMRGLRFIGSIRALGELGWICVLWFLYFMAGHFVLGKPLPGFGLYLVLTGFLLIAVFSNPKRSFVKASLLTIADLPLSFIRSFSDMVSYIRLFAVGYATLVVAVSFNAMSTSLSGNRFLNVVGAAFILVLGHGINIAMAAMAVLVHGIRLNVLEFSTHLEMTWSGRKYAPFRKK